MTRVYKSLIGTRLQRYARGGRNLEHCKTGHIITQSELEDMKKAVPNLRLISRGGCSLYKSSERVRPGLLQRTSIVAPQLDLWNLESYPFNRKCSFGACNGSDTEDAFACIGRESCLYA